MHQQQLNMMEWNEVINSVSDVTIIVIKPSVLSTDISGIIILNAPVLIMSIL